MPLTPLGRPTIFPLPFPELLLWSFMKPDEYQPAVKYDVNSDGAVNVTDTVFIVSELIE